METTEIYSIALHFVLPMSYRSEKVTFSFIPFVPSPPPIRNEKWKCALMKTTVFSPSFFSSQNIHGSLKHAYVISPQAQPREIFRLRFDPFLPSPPPIRNKKWKLALMKRTVFSPSFLSS